MFSIVFILYNILFPILFTLYSPMFIYRLYKRGGVDIRFLERFGIFTAAQKQRLAENNKNKTIWIHSVSVGETVAAISFIQNWQEENPEYDFVLSTGTTTGQELARKKAPKSVAVIYCPLDWCVFVWMTMRRVKPTMLVIFEVEIWPNLISIAAKTCKVVVANGRLSDRSAAKFAKYSCIFKPLMDKLSEICVQDHDDQLNFEAVTKSVPVHVCSTMKFDQILDQETKDMKSILDVFFGPHKRRCWVAGSTHEGEEKVILEVFQELRKWFHDLKLILVPRHAERANEVAKLIKNMEMPYRMLKEPGPEFEVVDILLVNTTGELMNFYSVADVVFVGKSFAGNTGGHNIIEPAIFGKPIIHGDNMQNFRKVTGIFKAARATIEIEDGDALEVAVKEVLADCEFSEMLTKRSREVVDNNRGAIKKTIDLFNKLLP